MQSNQLMLLPPRWQIAFMMRLFRLHGAADSSVQQVWQALGSSSLPMEGCQNSLCTKLSWWAKQCIFILTSFVYCITSVLDIQSFTLLRWLDHYIQNTISRVDRIWVVRLKELLFSHAKAFQMQTVPVRRAVYGISRSCDKLVMHSFVRVVVPITAVTFANAHRDSLAQQRRTTTTSPCTGCQGPWQSYRYSQIEDLTTGDSMQLLRGPSGEEIHETAHHDRSRAGLRTYQETWVNNYCGRILGL